MSAAARPLPVGAILKDAAVTSLVIFVLTVIMVGLELHDVPGAIELYTRSPVWFSKVISADVIAAVLIAFFGRIAIGLLREERPMPALVGSGVVVLALLVGLLAETLFGTATAVEIANRYLPFKSAVLRWCVLLAAVYIVLRALAQIRRGRRLHLSLEVRVAQADRAGKVFQEIALYLGPALLLIAVAAPFLPQYLPFLPFGRGQTLSIGITVLTYIMLGWGLNIVVGLAGLLDLGYVAFYAVGAYTYALFATTPGLEWSFWLCLPMAGMFAAFAGVLLGFPVLRLRGDYLAIVTLGFGEIVRIILQNWYSFTNGATGISSIPRPTFFGLVWEVEPDEGKTGFSQFFGLEHSADYEDMFLYYLIFGLALVVNFFTMRVRRLPVGRAWEALREDEIACRALGINPTNTKLTAFGLGAMFAGFAGSFFASKQGFISPESFVFMESAIVLALVVLGGFGSQLGVVLAAVILIILPEVFRDLRDFRLIAFGVAMVGIMLWRPSGLLAHREPTIRLHKAKGK